MILNIRRGTFGNCIRNGDLIAVANVLEHIRKTQNWPDLKFNIDRNAMSNADYVQKFYSFLLKHTNYFTEERGDKYLHWNQVNVWDYRDISGDLVRIRNDFDIENKIVVFPVMDAPYNAWRNWPKEVFGNIIKEFNSDRYKDYEKYICVTPNIKVEVEGWITSTDFMENIKHIMTAATYVGGDTGTSHFAWALDRSPPNLIYWSSSRGLVHTLPFYALRGKGVINSYWLNFEADWTPLTSKI